MHATNYTEDQLMDAFALVFTAIGRRLCRWVIGGDRQNEPLQLLAPTSPETMSIEDVMEFCQVEKKTVQNWRGSGYKDFPKQIPKTDRWSAADIHSFQIRRKNKE